MRKNRNQDLTVATAVGGNANEAMMGSCGVCFCGSPE